MHPRIEYLFSLIKDKNPENILNIEILQLLKDQGATRTEAAIMLHIGFEFKLEDMDDFVINSKIWPSENADDVFYQTLKYLYYNPDDPDYKADDNSVRVSF